MGPEGKDDFENADKHRISRDYAYARIELIESSDLLGYSLEDIKEIEDNFHSAQISVVSSLSPNDRSEELKHSHSFELKVKSIKFRLRKIAEVKPVVQNVSCVAKLPKINIPPFDGKAENWISFIQLFDSLVHKKEISGVEKLHYLILSVQGSAHELIKNYPLSDENYIVAYNTLKKHYENVRLITTMYYEKMLYCEPVKNQKSGNDLERVHRTFRENLDILLRFNQPDKNFLLFHLLWSKLDSATKEAFELSQSSNTKIPELRTLQEFIEKRARALENSKPIVAKPVAPPKAQKPVYLAPPPVCSLCNGSHSLINCSEFLSLTPIDRFHRVKQKRLCILCFSPAHSLRACTAGAQCAQCSRSHHTLLHFGGKGERPQSDNETTVLATHCLDKVDALFSTAIILIKDCFGNLVPIRALLDSGSACNFVTKGVANRLGLEAQSYHQSISGVGQVSTNAEACIKCKIMPVSDNNIVFSLDAFVLDNICPPMPSSPICRDFSWSQQKLQLADPSFDEPGPVDMLLSVNIFAAALRPGLIQSPGPGQPIAINTVFGWIIMGSCLVDTCRSRSRQYTDYPRSRANSTNCLFVSTLSLDNSIKMFWNLENIETPKNKLLSKEERQCEEQFKNNYRRTSEGRVVVPLPFREIENRPNFIDSRAIAFKRLLTLEKRLKLNPCFKEAYVDFMADYLEKRHMEQIDPPSADVGNFYYIPHHGILRPDSVTTPLRVVFDASAKDNEGKSLNDTLLPGPKLQKNIFDLLLRFRWHAVVFTGDIKQMYRQFLVPVSDAEYQRILWRPSPEEPVRDYKLLTVTYGVASAPYQALRSVAQLTEECAARCPVGAAVLDRDIYVDDVVSGTDSVENAVRIREEITTILSSARLHLRKWASNSEDFLRKVEPSDLYSEQFQNFSDTQDISLKILGLSWLPKVDTFTFKTSQTDGRCTKRSILSDIAKIFDPLGLLSPVVFLAKYLIQLLWSSGIDWDDEVPMTIAQQWQKFISQLPSLSLLSIPRRMIEPFVSLQLHGFCDASERGYCAVIYCRIISNDGHIVVRLCCAKSKVAPLRKCSIPRLELLAAVLLTNLVSSFAEALKDVFDFNEVYAWSDSSVALTWIRSCPSRWKTFVAHRVVEIQEKIPPANWHHVSGSDNPADCGSRGSLPADLPQNMSWWAGPSWLSNAQDTWPQSEAPHDQAAMDEQKIFSLFTESNIDFIDDILNRFSSLQYILRVLAYCFRYIHNSKNPSSKRPNINLSCEEIKKVLHFLIKHVQERAFASEIRALLKEKSPRCIPKSVRKLSPFLDAHGLLRVGGRLAKGELTFDVKHPLLLPRDHRLTYLVICDYHQRFMHPGLQTLQNLLAQEFWILSSKRAVHAVISSCIKCFRANPKVATPPIMGNLPAFRINQIKPFSSSAVDYAGPFDTSMARGRGLRTFKSYICIFVCTATKAIHLELVSELTSEAYIAALRRFIARRGRCSRLISDQGRNFIGAHNVLKDLMEKASHLEQIEFVFNPPGSPHFSGLAEAGVKSVKTHLSRVVGSQRLTFEEFYTVLTQIEALLNSRPLCPLSSDPSDFAVLTPGHFLTLEPLTIMPESNLVDTKLSPMQRWKLLQKIHQDFWRKWQVEYLHTLQQRHKWFDAQRDISVGALVMIVNEQCSPMKWKMGRVVELHHGSDGVCRVVTVRTDSGELKRPVVKLCPLPFQN